MSILDGKEEFIKAELKYRVAKSAIARKLEVSRGSSCKLYRIEAVVKMNMFVLQIFLYENSLINLLKKQLIGLWIPNTNFVYDILCQIPHRFSL